MEEIKSISPLAYTDLLKTNPKYSSRTYFKEYTHCEVVNNNLSESFNSWILETRYKPLISLLDSIRLQCMERVHKKRDYMVKIETTLCPRIIKKLNYSIDGSKSCNSTWGGGHLVEVKDSDGRQFIVNIEKRSFSCKRWELTGIPCTHGCQAIFYKNDDPGKHVDDSFKKETYMKAYTDLLCPVKGCRDWPRAEQNKLLPTKSRRMPGRPKKHRRKEIGEEGAGTKLSKKGVIMKCSRCLKIRHNKSTCKTSANEVIEIQRAVAEAKKAQKEAAKSHALRMTRNVQGKKTQSKRNISIGDGSNTESVQKKRRGRPPKKKNTQVQKKRPAGIGVFAGENGHIYLSSTTSTIRVTSSQPDMNK